MNRSLALVALSCAALSGCAILQPTQVELVADHVSHLSQHFGPDPTCLGYNALGVAAHWTAGRASLDVSETFNPGRVNYLEHSVAYGALAGPREVFSARVGFAIWRKDQ